MILAQLKECHQVLVMLLRRLLVFLRNQQRQSRWPPLQRAASPQSACVSCAGISLGLAGSQRACTSTSKFCEHLGSVQTGCYVLCGWKRVVFSLNCLVQVLGIQTQPYFPILLGNYHEGTDPWHWCRYRGNDVLFHHTAQLSFKLFMYCNRYSAGWMLDRPHRKSSCPTSSAKTSGKSFRRLSFYMSPFGLSSTE